MYISYTFLKKSLLFCAYLLLLRLIIILTLLLFLRQDCDKDCGVGGRCRKANDKSKLECISCAKGKLFFFLKI